jgi:pimeloyl-ACP methyl ester carboxylesterase
MSATQQVETSRGAFAVLDAPVPSGTPRRGHALLVPGFTGSKEDFAFVLPLLAQEGWHATAYDQRGQYETPGAPGDDFSLRGFAADALAVQEALAPQGGSHLVGHSFGGIVAQQAVLEDASAWRSLALLCSGPAGFDDPDVVAAMNGDATSAAMLRTFLDASTDQGLETVFDHLYADPGMPPKVQAFVRRRFLASAPASLRAIAEHLLDAPDHDAWPHGSQVRTAERLGVTAVVIADAGHSPAVDQPDVTAAWLLRAWAGRRG